MKMYITNCFIDIWKLVIVWCIWTYRSNVLTKVVMLSQHILLNWQSKLFDDMKYYHTASKVFVQHCVIGIMQIQRIKVGLTGSETTS